MTRYIKIALAAAMAAMMLRTACAAEPATAQPNLTDQFPKIREQLSSSDFTQREAGQKELDKIGPDQADALRTLAAQEKDPEVAERLKSRLDAMQEYLLLHPAPLSVDFKHAPIDEVARVLSQQLGGITITTLSGEGGDFTLKADHQSFWDIMTALNRQEPFNMSGLSTVVGGKVTPTLRLMLGGGAATQAWHLEGAVAMASPQISGQPANANWALRVTMIADPRVKIAQYSQIRVDKITDQDGRSLLHLVMPSSAAMSTLARPTFSWTGSVTMASAPELTRVKELRGTVVVSLVEHEQVTTLDLTKPGAIAGGPGVNVEKNAAGNWVIHLPSPVPAAGAVAPAAALAASTVSRGPAVTMRILDKDGTTISTVTATGGIQYTVSPAINARGPATVEVTWPDKLRSVVLPVVIKDVDAPPSLPAMIELEPTPRAVPLNGPMIRLGPAVAPLNAPN